MAPKLAGILMLAAALLSIGGVWAWWATQKDARPRAPFQLVATLSARTGLIELERALSRRNDDLRWDRAAFQSLVDQRWPAIDLRTKASPTLTQPVDHMRAMIGDAAQQGGPSVELARAAIAGVDALLAQQAQLDARTDEDAYLALLDAQARNATVQAILISLVLALMAGAAYLGMLYRLTKQRSLAERNALISRTRRAKDEALEALAAKNNLLAMISHELRSPIQTVVSSLDLLVSGSADPARIIPRVRRSAQSLLTLIGDLMSLAKAESISLAVGTSPMAISSVVAQGCDGRRGEAQDKGLRLNVQVLNPSPVVIGDPARLVQVIDNLVANAVQYTVKGSITVSVSEPDAKTGEYAITVRDTGIGISKEDQKRLFRPFTRLQPSTDERRRSGMGLTIVRALVNGMRGRIEVSSEPGVGTVFKVVLPSRHLMNQALHPFDKTEILVVDDEPDVLASVTDVLSQAGAPVTGVANGYAALSALEVRGEPPSIMLVDLNMPGMSGMELAQAVRRRAGPTRPILVAMSASVNLSQLGDNLFDGALAKPVDRETLIALVSSLSLPAARG